jgi:hypothetical protein
MTESENYTEFKSFMIAAAIAILLPIIMHYAVPAFSLGLKGAFLLKIFSSITMILLAIFLKIRVINTAIMVGGFLTFGAAIMSYWHVLDASLKFWCFLGILLLISVIGGVYEFKRQKLKRAF